jgi:hypothetical protein
MTSETKIAYSEWVPLRAKEFSKEKKLMYPDMLFGETYKQVHQLESNIGSE